MERRWRDKVGTNIAGSKGASSGITGIYIIYHDQCQSESLNRKIHHEIYPRFVIRTRLSDCTFKRLRSFNDTGDRALTTLARQPTYPSMPLRSEDCRMTLVKKDRRTSTIARHGSMTNEKELSGCMTGLVVCSPTYNMYSSAVKNSNYFVTDDEAVSRFQKVVSKGRTKEGREDNRIIAPKNRVARKIRPIVSFFLIYTILYIFLQRSYNFTTARLLQFFLLTREFTI